MAGRRAKPVRRHAYSAVPVVVHAPLLAKRLKEQMKAKGIGVRQLAEETKVDKTTISAWQRGNQRRVRVGTVHKVAAKLDTTVEHLLDLPPTLSDAGSVVSEQVALLKRVAALGPAVAALTQHQPVDLPMVLERHRRRLAEIDQVLTELDGLAKAASETGGPKRT